MVVVKFQDGSITETTGSDLMEVFESINANADPSVVSVALYVNGNLQSPRENAVCDAVTVRPAPINTLYGAQIVRRSLVHLFVAAASAASPASRFVLRYTNGYAWYFAHYACGASEPSPIPAESVVAIEAAMEDMVKNNTPFNDVYLSYDDALALFEAQGAAATVALLRSRTDPVVRLVDVAGSRALWTGPVAPYARLCGPFRLHGCHAGVCVQYPHHLTPTELGPWTSSTALVRTHERHADWARRLGIDSVGGVNTLISSGHGKHLIQYCDTQQERYIAEVADAVPADTRLVLIAGPSSSGKTTFSRKLSVHLRCRGFEPIYLSGDDFFVNREDTPRNPDGSYDFEAVEAIDLPYLNDFLRRLCDGEELPAPTFDFKLGRRVFKPGRTVKLAQHGLLVVEGIHQLNPRTSEGVTGNKFKVFISPLASMQISDFNPLSSSDTRLVRRIVRDFKYRGFPCSSTIAMWPNVIEGERKHIYTYQGCADVAFNSALNYEIAVLRNQAAPLLHAIVPSDPSYCDARRLLRLLDEYATLDESLVPCGSILQEFLGYSYLFSS